MQVRDYIIGLLILAVIFLGLFIYSKILYFEYSTKEYESIIAIKNKEINRLSDSIDNIILLQEGVNKKDEQLVKEIKAIRDGIDNIRVLDGEVQREISRTDTLLKNMTNEELADYLNDIYGGGVEWTEF